MVESISQGRPGQGSSHTNSQYIKNTTQSTRHTTWYKTLVPSPGNANTFLIPYNFISKECGEATRVALHD